VVDWAPATAVTPRIRDRKFTAAKNLIVKLSVLISLLRAKCDKEKSSPHNAVILTILRAKTYLQEYLCKFFVNERILTGPLDTHKINKFYSQILS